MSRAARLLILLPVVWLAGCDLLGIEPASSIAARREAEGKAVGAACRHAGRAIEDCYEMNKRSDKSAVFAGWREMNDYMTENKIEVVKPLADQATSVAAQTADDAADAAKKSGAKGDDGKGGRPRGG